MSNKLPEALGADISKLVYEQNNTIAGSSYLLQTIQDKLNDVTDLARPNLKNYSSTAGVGLFIGTSAINQFIEAWGKLNSLFGSSIDMGKHGIKGIPLSPSIYSERINEGNKLAIDKALDGEEFSPTQFSFVVNPVAPVIVTVGAGVSYEFQRRTIYLNKDVPNIPDYSEAEFTDDILNELYTGGSYVTRRTSELPEKIPSGKYYAIAIDIYKIPSNDPDKLDKYIYLSSEVKPIAVVDTTSNRYTSGLISARGFDSITIDPTARYPMWIASEGSLALLPLVFGTLVEFINFLKATISSLLDDALNFLKTLLENLATIIDAYKAIVLKIDALIELIQLLMSLTGSLGVSVMSFFGTGDSSALYSMFQEYLDQSVSSTTNFGPPQEKDIRNSKVLEEPTRLQSWSDQVESGLLPDTLVRTGTSYLDPTGSINVVKGDRVIVQDEELKAILGDSDPNIPSITTALNSSYNMSPIFTDEMTCAGVILLAHSHIEQNLVSFRTLLNLLFESEENAPDTDQRELLEEKGLTVDQPNLEPSITSEIVENPVALFTADMKLTQDPQQSPFNFCPSDE